MKRFIAFVFGYYIVRTSSEQAKKIINIIIKNDLPCYLPRTKDEFFFVHVSFFGMKKFFELVNKSNIPFEIIESRGIPFVIDRYKKRSGLFFGTVLGIVSIVFSINFVWDIEFQNREFSPELLEKIQRSGVSYGSFIPFLNIQDSENIFLLENEEYSFVAINIRGTVAYVELNERKTKEPSKESDIKYSNIVASDNGVIYKVEAKGGFPIVSKGQVVLQGQVLISGVYDRLYGGVGLRRSSGRVFAQCSKYIEFSVPLEQVKTVNTGRSKTFRSINIFGLVFPNNEGYQEDFELEFLTEKYERLKLFGFIRVPIDVHEVRYYEQENKTILISIEEAERIAKAEIENICLETAGEDGMVLEKDLTFSYDEKTNSIVVTGELVFIKDIALEVPFEVQESSAILSIA